MLIIFIDIKIAIKLHIWYIFSIYIYSSYLDYLSLNIILISINMRIEGKVVRQKPAVPPKPNIPKPVGPQGPPGTPGTPVVVIGTPQRVHASMKELPERGNGVE